jgi:hypothetical protein
VTHIETRRVNETLNLQIAAIRDYAARLSDDDLDRLGGDLAELEQGIRDLKDMLEALPHHHA